MGEVKWGSSLKEACGVGHNGGLKVIKAIAKGAGGVAGKGLGVHNAWGGRALAW